MSTRLPKGAAAGSALPLIRGILQLAVIVLIGIAALIALMVIRQPGGHNGVGAGVGSSTTVPLVSEHDATAAGADTVLAKRVADAEDAAMQQMVKDFGVSCWVGGDGYYVWPPESARGLDEKILAADLASEGWIAKGELWLGSAEGAAKAFGATTLYADDHSFWMFIVEDGAPRARELIEVRSASGKAAWLPFAQISAASCTSDAAPID